VTLNREPASQCRQLKATQCVKRSLRAVETVKKGLIQSVFVLHVRLCFLDIGANS
jgi:hypothetical protein